MGLQVITEIEEKRLVRILDGEVVILVENFCGGSGGFVCGRTMDKAHDQVRVEDEVADFNIRAAVGRLRLPGG